MKTNKRRRAKGRKTYPVPVWMDDELKAAAQHMSLLERCDAAEKLENRAAQLRGFTGPPLRRTETVAFLLTKNQAQALRRFGVRHGAPEDDPATQLACGARWFVEHGLSLLREVASATATLTRYRDAEGLAHTAFMDALAEKSLRLWEEQLEKEDGGDPVGELQP